MTGSTWSVRNDGLLRAGSLGARVTPAKMTLPNEELELLLLRFELGELMEARTLPQGTVQLNILLVTAKGKFVARFYQNRSSDYVRFELHLLLFLSTRGYPSPVPIRNSQGDMLTSYRGKPVAVFTFLEGSQETFPHRVRQVAGAIARLHLLTEDLRLDGHQFRDAYDRESCSRSARRSSAALASPQEASARVSWIEKQLESIELPESLPTGVCHCDTNPTNFLFRGGQLSAVLDFDMAASMPFVYDVACLMYWWACPGGQTISFPALREVLGAYGAQRPLKNMERHHLYDALKMLMLMSLSWFADAPNFWSEVRGFELLCELGRDGFMRGALQGTVTVL